MHSVQQPPKKQDTKYCVRCHKPTWPSTHMANSFAEAYEGYCFHDAFWCSLRDKLVRGEGTYFVAVSNDDFEIHVYVLGTPAIDWENPPSCLGHGGRWWCIEYTKDGEHELTFTNNLWSNGIVPNDWRDEFLGRVNVNVMRTASRQEVAAIRREMLGN